MGGLVFRVERVNGKVKKVVIPAGQFDITFVERNGRVVRESVRRHDRSGNFYVPPYLFEPAINQARDIFAENKKRQKQAKNQLLFKF